MSLILSRSNDAFIAMDADGRITEWNARAEAIFGWPRSEVIGRRIAETLIPPQWREVFISALRHFLVTGEGPLLNRRNEVPALHREGHEILVSLSVTPIRMDETWFFSVFLHEISGRKLHEHQLEEHQLELDAANVKLVELASTDGLTGIKNHASFHQRLDEAFDIAKRHGSPLSVIMLDIDRFKQYNDQRGHSAGDQLLKTVALLLLKKARSYDLIARYGGDEFAVILPRTDSYGASIMGDRFRRAIERTFWPTKAVTVSCGIATITGTTPSADALIQQADSALYEAKRQGCNRIVHANALPGPD